DKLEFDKELLRRLYLTSGYTDFSVLSANAYQPEGEEDFVIDFELSEGPKYSFGKISVESSIKNIDLSAIEESIETIEGEIFNAALIESSIDAITNIVAEKGYAFVAIDPIINKNSKKQLVNITYNIKQGSKIYIENINITGNTRTLDKVIRREFRLHETDPYNASKIRRSRQRIQNLGFFEKVDLKTNPGSAKDKANIDLNVVERSTGELNFGAGFSTTDGALANTSIRERNFLGKGQDLELSLQTATQGIEIDLSFTEPYFMDKDLALGFDIFKITRDRESESSFDSDTVGSTVNLTYSIFEELRHTIRYSFRADDITNIEEDASRFIQDQAGENTTSLFGHSLFYDKRDRVSLPTSGYSLRFIQDFAGIGGDSEFIRNELRGNYFTPLFDNKEIVLKLSAQTGYIWGMTGEDIRINERFFIGGNDIRGFETAGIGPRDIDTLDSLGGNLYYTASSEVRYPLGLPKELGVLGATFIDVGSLTSVDDNGEEVVDESSLRLSVGVGISWNSPIGPIRLDYAEPVVKEDFDKTQKFKFTFGARF
ncbi:MAG: outer membrane protein assembly factor BamA, partial [Pseudomonadota bacterium]